MIYVELFCSMQFFILYEIPLVCRQVHLVVDSYSGNKILYLKIYERSEISFKFEIIASIFEFEYQDFRFYFNF